MRTTSSPEYNLFLQVLFLASFPFCRNPVVRTWKLSGRFRYVSVGHTSVAFPSTFPLRFRCAGVCPTEAIQKLSQRFQVPLIGPTRMTTTKMTTSRMSSKSFEENTTTTENNSTSCSKSLGEHCRNHFVAVLVALN